MDNDWAKGIMEVLVFFAGLWGVTVLLAAWKIVDIGIWILNHCRIEVI